MGVYFKKKCQQICKIHFTCEMCWKVFIWNGNIYNHKMTHKFNKETEGKGKGHNCMTYIQLM